VVWEKRKETTKKKGTRHGVGGGDSESTAPRHTRRGLVKGMAAGKKKVKGFLPMRNPNKQIGYQPDEMLTKRFRRG